MISDDDWFTPTIHCSNGTKLPIEESTMPQLSILKKYVNKQMRITLPVSLQSLSSLEILVTFGVKSKNQFPYRMDVLYKGRLSVMTIRRAIV